MRLTFSVHAFLMALVAATLLPVLIFGGLLVHRAELSERELMSRTARDAAHAAAIDVSRRIDGLRALALTMAAARTLREGDLAAFHLRWAGVMAREGVTAALYDAAGRQLVDTSVPFGAPLPAESEAVHRVIGTGEAEISDLVRGGNERPVVKITVPIRRGDEITYILSLHITEAVAAVLAEQVLLPEQFITLTDRAGIVIHRTREPERFATMPGRPEFLRNFEGREAGVFVDHSFEGVPVYVAFSRVKPVGWVLAVLIPARSMSAPAMRSLGALLAFGVLMLLLAGALAWTIGRAIARSVAGLSGLGASLVTGTPGGRPPPARIREINAVAASMRAAAEALGGEVERRRSAERQLAQAQKMEAIGQITGGMAHDFNNLLAVVVGCLDILRERVADDPDGRELAEEAISAAARGSELTRQLLAFARRQPLAPERCDINGVIRDFAGLLARTLGEDISIDFQQADDLWPAMADRAQLEASVMNLATNARHAMRRGGRLTIATANAVLDAGYAAARTEVAPGDYALIEVRDTGTGMSAEVADRIFEPFFTTREPGQGTGLGLAMVFGFAKQSGGHIGVYSEVGEGTTFRLYLPRARDAIPSPEPAPPPSMPPPEKGRGEVILAVEDNPALRRVLVRQLAAGGYRVLEAENARTALDRLEGNEGIDLLLTDIVMPGGMNGHQLARIAVLLRPDLRVVLTSGFSDMANGGAVIPPNTPVLRKPYRREELLRIVRGALGE